MCKNPQVPHKEAIRNAGTPAPQSLLSLITIKIYDVVVIWLCEVGVIVLITRIRKVFLTLGACGHGKFLKSFLRCVPFLFHKYGSYSGDHSDALLMVTVIAEGWCSPDTLLTHAVVQDTGIQQLTGGGGVLTGSICQFHSRFRAPGPTT